MNSNNFNVPRILLGSWPTPMLKAKNLAQALGISHLYIKCEDHSGSLDAQGIKLFGGNKVRKLEFLLADALRRKYKTVITFGGVGSNHVVATAAYAKQVGLQSIALLMEQPITDNLQRNLLLDQYYGCKLFAWPHDVPNEQELRNFLRSHHLDENPYVIPMGGSNVLGAIGHVNAIFELKEQIETGILPEPDWIYVACGSMATTAGLLLGIKAAGLKTKVKAVRVTNNPLFTLQTLCALVHETNRYLHNADASFARCDWDFEEIILLENYIGQGYAYKTSKGQAARDLFKNTENILLDETYTAKAAAALVDDSKKGLLKNQTILFWNTYCSDSYANILQMSDYRNLPPEFHKYFA